MNYLYYYLYFLLIFFHMIVSFMMFLVEYSWTIHPTLINNWRAFDHEYCDENATIRWRKFRADAILRECHVKPSEAFICKPSIISEERRVQLKCIQNFILEPAIVFFVFFTESKDLLIKKSRSFGTWSQDWMLWNSLRVWEIIMNIPHTIFILVILKFY